MKKNQKNTIALRVGGIRKQQKFSKHYQPTFWIEENLMTDLDANGNPTFEVVNNG